MNGSDVSYRWAIAVCAAAADQYVMAPRPCARERERARESARERERARESAGERERARES
jgi:hypothetical protein